MPRVIIPATAVEFCTIGAHVENTNNAITPGACGQQENNQLEMQGISERKRESDSSAISQHSSTQNPKILRVEEDNGESDNVSNTADSGQSVETEIQHKL